MGELAGLLDTARTKIRGLLGDFPEGFNSGAVAGMAGWPGDMAYMADTARRAALGERTGPAAQDFPGTTDYLAAQAGYPIPQTMSGQLGSLVGGFLSPSPADFAKVGPFLAAIPFWHGSPHKYDAVDLSRIGTGEGAQAYGWGYYGADSQDVAKSYMPRDPKIEEKLMRHYKAAEARQDYDAMQVYEDALLHKSPEEIAGVYPEKQFQPHIENVRKLYEQQSGQMYRGEYRWPDPAKEASTPLTGDDLLQWDRPLSEQPGIMERLRAAGMAEGDEVFTIEGAKPAKDITGEGFYDIISAQAREGDLPEQYPGSIEGASRYLNDAGIPGIRYLDGMSRSDGTGTYNYVMFDDTGIKLLERNGSPIEQFAERRAGKMKPYREAAGSQ